MGLPDGEEIVFVLTQYRRDWRTDKQTDGRTCCDPYYPC